MTTADENESKRVERAEMLDSERVDRAMILAEAATVLSEQVADLSEDIGVLSRRAKRAERFITLITLSLVVDFILTITVSFLVANNITTQSRIATICPLYAFTLGTYAPITRRSGSDRDLYVQQFADMRLKFESLGCNPQDYPLVPAAPPVPAGMSAPPGN